LPSTATGNVASRLVKTRKVKDDLFGEEKDGSSSEGETGTKTEDGPTK